MKKKEIEPYYVINWDVNRDNIEYYNVMPYLMDCYKETKKTKRKKTPETFDEIKQFILDEAMYQYWSRCEYEVIVTGWSKHKNEVKIDVFQQIKNNIDVITKHFINQL